ncbi:MAG: NfeD family protein [Oscillospiraceae bacterium]|nr:NfeD family protein [Oscillospiraceae bacterium]
MMDFLMNNMWVIWLVLFIASIILEAISFQLFSIWFALGAVVALVASLLGAPIWLQILLFIVVSGAALGATRPLVRKIQRKQEPTNADRYVDQAGVVLEKIDNVKGTGQVKVLGQVWTARTKDGSEIAKGASVRTIAIEGVKLYVETAE